MNSIGAPQVKEVDNDTEHFKLPSVNLQQY